MKMSRHSESQLLGELLDWLWRSRRVNGNTLVVPELPWFGRHVDLATMTLSGWTTAYELKIRNNARAIRQAAYNSFAFDRSYVVSASVPGADNLRRASETGVGFIVILGDQVKLIQSARPSSVDRIVKDRLHLAIRSQKRKVEYVR